MFLRRGYWHSCEKFASRRAPAPALFSGWNWTP